MSEKKPIVLRDNEIPQDIDWSLVSSVEVYGWLNPESVKFIHKARLVHHKTISWKDEEAVKSRDSMESIDER